MVDYDAKHIEKRASVECREGTDGQMKGFAGGQECDLPFSPGSNLPKFHNPPSETKQVGPISK